jgi:immune inhibitor A
MYYSGQGNGLDNSMTREVTLGTSPINVAFKAKFHIESCWDYAYLQVSDDDGDTWDNIHTSASTADNTNGQNFGEGITGVSGSPLACDDLSASPQWVNVTANLNAYHNQTVLLRLRYWTDGAVVGMGFSFDNLQITGLANDTAESDPGWEYDGFLRMDGSFTNAYFNAYVLENRQYIGYDYSLLRGPYNFGFPAKPNFVEHFPLQNGLLVWYWDESFADNNVGDHPGGGLILPVDSHKGINTWTGGSQVRPRVNAYDAPFTLAPTDAITLHNPADGVAKTIPSLPGVSTFNDNLSYWVGHHSSDAPANGRYQAEWNSVKVPHTGTQFRITELTSQKVVIQLNQ